MSHLDEAKRLGRAIKADDGSVVAHAHPKASSSYERTQWVATLTGTGAKSWDQHGMYGARAAIKEFANAQGTTVQVMFNGREVSKIYPDADRWAPTSGTDTDPGTAWGRGHGTIEEAKRTGSSGRGIPRSGDYRGYWFFVGLWDFRDPSQGYAATLFNRRGQSVNSINGNSEEEVRTAAKKHWPGAVEKQVVGEARHSSGRGGDRKAAWMRAYQDAAVALGAHPGQIDWQRAEFFYHQGDDPSVAAKRAYGGEMREVDRSVPRSGVADFDNLEALIEHSRGEGATHVFVGPGDTRLYFPADRGRYQEASARQQDGYWHIQAPNYRPVVSLPAGVEPIENFQFYQQPGRRREGAALRRGGAARRRMGEAAPGQRTRRAIGKHPVPSRRMSADVIEVAHKLSKKVGGSEAKPIGSHRWSDVNESAIFTTYSPEYNQKLVVLVSAFEDSTYALDFFSDEYLSETNRYENIVHFMYRRADLGEMVADIKWVCETVDGYAESWQTEGDGELEESRSEFSPGDAVQFRFEPGTGGVIDRIDNGEASVKTPVGMRKVPLSALWLARPEHVDRTRRSVKEKRKPATRRRRRR